MKNRAVKAKCAYCWHFTATEYNRKGKPEYGMCGRTNDINRARTHASLKCESFKLDPAVNGTVNVKGKS